MRFQTRNSSQTRCACDTSYKSLCPSSTIDFDSRACRLCDEASKMMCREKQKERAGARVALVPAAWRGGW